ncbi:hypothetical protein [Nocardioides sp.]|uniref:hypothetical protein n=1 Tax=Nocardioides sp. TaxID=35761 RepID=UPI0035152981
MTTSSPAASAATAVRWATRVAAALLALVGAVLILDPSEENRAVRAWSEGSSTSPVFAVAVETGQLLDLGLFDLGTSPLGAEDPSASSFFITDSGPDLADLDVSAVDSHAAPADRVLLNYGLAALVWLGLGLGLARVLERVATDTAPA